MISRKARIGKNADIHPLAYIEDDAEIGDNTQIDLVSKNDSGLLDAEKKLSKIQDIGFIYLNDKDVVRHNLVRKIINAYDSNSKIYD